MMESFVPHDENFHLIEKRLISYGVPTRSKQMSEYVWSTPESKSRALEELYLESGGEILYDATVVDCIVDRNRIIAVIVLTSGGFVAVEAEQFVDASGDAWLSRMSGVPVAHGDDQGNDQMSSLRFEMGGIDVEKYRDYCLSIDDHFSPLVEVLFGNRLWLQGSLLSSSLFFEKA